MFDKQMGMQPILPVTVSVKKIKSAARQRNVVTVGVDEPFHRDLAAEKPPNKNFNLFFNVCFETNKIVFPGSSGLSLLKNRRS